MEPRTSADHATDCCHIIDDGTSCCLHITTLGFLANASSLFSTYTINQVTLNDKLPCGYNPGSPEFPFAWLRLTWEEDIILDHWIPDVIVRFLQPSKTTSPDEEWMMGFYPTEEMALQDLSNACVAYGKMLTAKPT